MCISNKQAFEIVVGLKRFYHQYGLGHVVLLVSYVFFLLTFASAFFIIESTNSNAYYSQWRASVAVERQRFITNDLLPEIFNNTRILVFIHDHKSQYLNKLMQQQLNYYEDRIKLKPPMPILKCTFTNSFLFAFSTIMTIGYGSIYPVTMKGRIISILFSLMGIPYTIIVIKDLEYLLVKVLSYPCILFVQMWHIFRYCTLQAVSEDEAESKMTSTKIKTRPDYRISTAERLMLMPIMVAVFALVGWISVGCVIGYFYMPHVNNHVLIYFIFNSLATIGVGDIDLGEQPLIVFILFIYVIAGLSIVSLFINLLHTKFSRAYWLPGQMYMPLLQQQPINLATVDSFDEDPYHAYAEPPIYRYTTLGIFQAEDRCPLINELRKGTAKIDASTQTQPAEKIYYQRPLSPQGIIMKQQSTTSRDDVNSLIVETYGGRPARIITNSEKRPLSMA